MTWVLVVFVLGVNLTFWASVGIARTVAERASLRVREHQPARQRALTAPAPESSAAVGRADLAVLIPAHNEERGIAATIASVRQLLPASQIHVVSDGSSDDTTRIARACGVNVLEVHPAGGKARALQAGIDRWELTRRYKAVLFLDGDTQLDRLYLASALPLLANPEYVAVAGYATTKWPNLRYRQMLFIAHRQRIYVLMQMLLKFGQTAKRLNVTHIVPGFASIYRSEAIDRIDITAPGLIIEDFNMTFEVHRKRLGKIAFTPHAFAYTQDPDNLRDYVKQVRRWTLGFWQTVRRHGVWPSLFSASLLLFITELLTSGLTFVLLPLVVIVQVLPALADAVWLVPGFEQAHGFVAAYLPLPAVALGAVVPDLLISAAVAWRERRPSLLRYAPMFLPLRVVDAVLVLYTIPLAFRGAYSGVWQSPTRR